MERSSDRQSRASRFDIAPVAIATCAIALLTYTILRAITVSFTWDESWTYIHHVIPKVFISRAYDQMGANYHPLNVWGMILSNTLFGNSELALRLPVLLAHAIYLYASARIALRARTLVLSIAAFLLLNAHPYLLDFFSLARGYGIANGMMMLSLWLATRYLSDGRQLRDLGLAVAAAVLATLSHLIMLNYLLAFTAAFILIWVFDTLRHHKVPPWRHAGLLIGGTGLALVAVVPFAVRLSMGGALYFGCDSLWDCTMETLGMRLLYGQAYGITPQPMVGLVIALLAACSMACVGFAFRNGWAHRLRPMAFGTIIVVSCVASFALQHLLLGTPMPRTRTALFLLPLALFVPVSGLVAWPGRSRIPVVAACLLCLPLLFHQIWTINLTYALEWKPAGGVGKMLSMIRAYHAPLDPMRPAILVRSGFECWGSIPYYQIQDSMQWLIATPMAGQGPIAPADFYIVEEPDTARADPSNWILLYRSPGSGTRLYRDLRHHEVPKVIYHDSMDMEAASVPGRTAEAHVSGKYSVRFDAASRFTQPLVRIVTDTLRGPDLQVLATAMIQQPSRLNWTALLVRITRGPVEIARADANSGLQMNQFGRWTQVALPVYLNFPLLPGDEIHLEAWPLTDDTVMYLDDLNLWVLQ